MTSELHHDRTIIYSCKYHVIFCPKYRRKLLVPPLDRRLKEQILEKQAEYGYEVIEMEVMADHVHLLLDVDPRIGIDTVVRKIKGYTAHSLRQEHPWMKSSLPSMWTRSRFIASVGSVSLEVVKQYIQEQQGQ
jgi:putative transposase